MKEIELKFQIPAPARPALAKAVATARAERVRLQAAYFDTPDRDLARAGIALRLRREGRRWVQTLKALGERTIERLEHNVPLAALGATPPPLDPARHWGTPAGDRLAAVLGALPAPQPELVCLFRTDIRRVVRPLRTRGGVVEVAHDTGHLISGGRRQPVDEVEFELLSGPPQALLAVAASWQARHRLWLDVRSKAERGERLTRGMDIAPAAKARPAALDPQAGTDAALRTMAGECLAQVLANAAEIADEAYAAEHVHQLRVAMRRLRSLLKALAGWSPAVEPAWEPALAEAFGRLGGTRDRDVVAAAWQSRLEAAGLAGVQLDAGAADGPAPGEIVRDPALQSLLLALLGFVSGDPLPSSGEPLAAAFAASLEGQWRKLRRDAARFARLDDPARHRVRKRMKRLRYVAEYAAPLWKKKRSAAFLDALRDAQEALGDYNDACVARALFAERADVDPRAWFAVGWIDGQKAATVLRCQHSLDALAEARRFWRDLHAA